MARVDPVDGSLWGSAWGSVKEYMIEINNKEKKLQ